MRFPALSRFTRLAAALAATAGVSGAMTALPAAPASAAPLATHVFSYADLPDYDQERLAGTDALGNVHAGLANGGRLYCAPTSSFDALAFLSQHGAPGLVGSPLFGGFGTYEQITAKINELANLMGIDPYKIGTTQGGLQSGLLAWNAKYGTTANHFGIVAEFPSGSQAPNLGIADLAEAFGNPVLLRIGFYKPATVTINNQQVNVLERFGGHSVAMTGFDNGGINFMDPDDAGGPHYTQSAFTNVSQPIKNVSAIFADSKGNPYHSDLSTDTYVNLPGYAGGQAYIEGYTIIQPSFTLTAKSNQFTIARLGRSIVYKVAGTIADAQLSPAGDAAYYTTTTSKTVFKLTLATGVSTPLTRTSADAAQLAVNTQGDTVYAAAGRTIAAVSNTGTPVARTTLPTTVAALAFDPVRGQVDAVTPKSTSVTVLAPTLTKQGSVTLPASAVKNAGDIDASVDPATGNLKIKAAGVATTTISAAVSAAATTTATAPASTATTVPLTSVASQVTQVSPATATTPVATTTTVAATAPVTVTPTATSPATATTTVSASTVASLANKPVVTVTPVSTKVTSRPISALVHGALIAKPTTSVALNPIVRSSFDVLATGYEGDAPVA